MEKDAPLNVLGGTLDICGTDPVTGFFRDGFCNTCARDEGSHTVCARVTEEFLAFSKYVGNDLSTPRPGFAGLKPGEQWCLCAGRFLQAHEESCAPDIRLEATHIRALDIVSIDVLKEHAVTEDG